MTSLAAPDYRVRYRIRVAGVVQGVGFRPFVHRLATELGLAGCVGNDTEGVFVEVEGATTLVESFEVRLMAEAPALARILEVRSTTVDAVGESGFRIVESSADGGGRTFVSPDVAVCPECLTELFDPSDRRYRYPFVNCTNCGPRFTITRTLPYDRPNTTMSGFSLCEACYREYHDPLDRRFHAQPVACAACGPRLWFEGATGTIGGTDAALAATQEALAAGDIVAMKGLGGYHLACSAGSGSTVGELRRRKDRPDKPFAVMACDLAVAEQLALIGAHEAGLLVSGQAPIVLLPRRPDGPLAPEVAPENPYIGIFLPYTPMHHLLFRPVPGGRGPVPEVLVMTSGNLSDEPICYDDVDARQRLGRIADAWLVHDRPIHVPCDDSVVRVDAGHELPLRRSRGYAPLPVRLPFDVAPMLATGGELKNTFCLASGRDAWMSQHIGDMGSIETLSAFDRSTRQFADFYGVEAKLVATDAHPGYQTRRWAEAHAADGIELVQHHHAHVAAVMVENGVEADERVIGFAFDGTGYGTDGSIWGGEILIVGYGSFERVGHLGEVALPGGDATIRKPYRAALAHLLAAGIPWSPDLAPVQFATAQERAVIARQLERGVQCVRSSCMGRLFDAVSSLLGVRHAISYEAQAAIELERVAAAHLDEAGDYRFEVTDGEIDATTVLRSIVADQRRGHPVRRSGGRIPPGRGPPDR
jgi:hydrogenase maturation protein HypF